jgi:hypothetical protein
MGFNDYPNEHFADTKLLNTVLQQIRVINSHLHWQRFLARDSH